MQGKPTPPSIAAKIRAKLAEGLSLRTVARMCGVSYRTVLRFADAHHIIRSRRRVDVTRIRKLLGEGLSVRVVAERTGVSRSTVSKVKSGHYDHCKPEAVDPDSPQQLDKPIRCPHPDCRVLITMLPCQTCRAAGRA